MQIENCSTCLRISILGTRNQVSIGFDLNFGRRNQSRGKQPRHSLGKSFLADRGPSGGNRVPRIKGPHSRINGVVAVITGGPNRRFGMRLGESCKEASSNDSSSPGGRIVFRAGGRVLVFMVKIQTEVWFRFSSRNLDWNFCPGPVFAEESVGRP